MVKVANTNTFKSSIIQDRFNQGVNGVHYFNKMKNKSEIQNRFKGTKEYKNLLDKIEGIKYEKSDLRNNSMSLTKLKDLKTKVESEKTKYKFESLPSFLEVDLAKAKDGNAKYKKTLETINKKINELNSDSAKLTDAKNKKKELQARLDKETKAFVSEGKASFDAWKKELLEPIYDTSAEDHKKTFKQYKKDYETDYDYLEEQLSKVSDPKLRELYKLYVDQNKANKECIILSRGPQVIKFLLNKAIDQYFTRSVEVYHRQMSNKISESDRQGEEDLELKPKVEPVDLALIDLSGSAYQFILDTGALRDLKSDALSDVELSGTPSYEYLHELGLKSVLLGDVKKYDYSRLNILFKEDTVILITGLLDDLITRLSEIVNVVLKAHNKTTCTLKADIFHNILEPSFIIKGDDYKETKEEIDGLWGKSKD